MLVETRSEQALNSIGTGLNQARARSKQERCMENKEWSGGNPVLREFEDIPGTYFFNGRRSRAGFALNMFCMSLLKEENRTAFRADEDTYLDGFKVTPEQRQAIRNREWITMLQLGGNIYYTFKLAACDGMTFQQLAALQTGVTEQQYLDMMVAGGRSVEGNRSKAEWANHG
jgi:protocatechuate 4,5-dioxygenase, alpha chain